MSFWVFLLGLHSTLHAHAPPIPTPKAPYSVRGPSLFDADRNRFVLNGVQITLDPQLARRPILRILRQRWNLNTVRLVVEPEEWARQGIAYLERIHSVVSLANAEGLVAILAAAGSEAGLPGSIHSAFWAAAGAYFKDEPMVVFSLYAKPSASRIPESGPTARRPEDWNLWRNGGTLSSGDSAIGMQQLVSTIRAAGANQLIAVPGFRDRLGWQGFTRASPPNSILRARI